MPVCPQDVLGADVGAPELRLARLRREVPNHPPRPAPEVEHAITGLDDVAALLEELPHGGHVLIGQIAFDRGTISDPQTLWRNRQAARVTAQVLLDVGDAQRIAPRLGGHVLERGRRHEHDLGDRADPALQLALYRIDRPPIPSHHTPSFARQVRCLGVLGVTFHDLRQPGSRTCPWVRPPVAREYGMGRETAQAKTDPEQSWGRRSRDGPPPR